MTKHKNFADDGWAIWVTGDDVSTFYLNEWVDPKGKNFVDVSVRIRGVKQSHELSIYIPFVVDPSEIEDISYHLRDENYFRAIFSTRRIYDDMKNKHTSELAYHAKTVDLVHLSTVDYEVKPLASGTLVTIPIDALQPYLDNDEAYFMLRFPHRNLDELFEPKIDVQNAFGRLCELITTPVVSEKFACSVRVNEARLLPDEINQIGAFHRQKLDKALVTVSVHEDYQVTDANCYRIHRLEQELYGEYAPAGFDCTDIVTYEWHETRETNLRCHYNFYFGISRDSISRLSMLLYVVLLVFFGLVGNAVSSVVLG